MQWALETYEVDTEPSRIDFAVVHGFLKTSYWASHRTLEQVTASWENATVQFGLYDAACDMVGGCRIISDSTTFAWLGDVFVLTEHRTQGLGKFLVSCVVDHPAIAKVEQVILATQDAHGLYRQFGWRSPPAPERLMLRLTT